jgi:hypothetical protein
MAAAATAAVAAAVAGLQGPVLQVVSALLLARGLVIGRQAVERVGCRRTRMCFPALVEGLLLLLVLLVLHSSRPQ